MPKTLLPKIPFIAFAVIEPALLYIAHRSGMSNPQNYFADLVPENPIGAKEFSPQALGMTLQMANILLLLALLALVACFSQDPFTVKAYIAAVALADYGHIYGTYKAVGAEYFWNVGGWNSSVAGHVGASLVLNVLRLLTLAGAFGTIGDVSAVKKMS
ncbi:hypothetical protein V8F20_011897 [Naviculisporaceae sp. PSN 640]